MTWQKGARLVIVVAAVTFAVVVALAFRGRSARTPAASLVRTDPKAVVESIGGSVRRFNKAQEEVRIEYERQLTYQDGTTRLQGVKVVTENRGGRSFTVSGREAQVAEKESAYILTGNVSLAASDGLTARTERATYSYADAIVRAPGPVEFGNGRMSGSGMAMIYDKNADVLTIGDQAVVRIAPDERGAGAADVSAGAAFFGRREKIVRFERGLTVHRNGQVIQADNGLAHLSPDEKRIERLELHAGAKVTADKPSPGNLQELTGRDLELKYAEDGQALERLAVSGDSVVHLAGTSGGPGRRITADRVEMSMAPDGVTPMALAARDAVVLTLPAEQTTPTRTIRSNALDAEGEEGRGLTRATFLGNVEYREKDAMVDRLARSTRLDVQLKPAFAAIDLASFKGNARFSDTGIFGTAATVQYVVESGSLELTGSEQAVPVPHVSNEQIDVFATSVNVTLAGPVVDAEGSVKSVLQPAKKQGQAGAGKTETRLPSMLKQDQAINVTATKMNYDGGVSKATYTGAAQLWQTETSIKANSIVVDSKAGDLTADGSVTTTTMLDQVDKNHKKERVRSVGTAAGFKFEDAIHRATYQGDAHIAGPQGDITAQRIELYLKPSGDELERAEAYESLTLREQSRKTTGSRLTYTSSNETYVVLGTPVTIVDECARQTTGATLTFVKGTDTIVMDGNERVRTQTKGGDKCPP